MTSIPASFNVSASAGVLGSYFASTADKKDNFSALNGKSGNSATTDALSMGKMNATQHKFLVAVASATDGKYTQEWNANGTEPNVITGMRQLGWLKLVKQTKGEDGKKAGIYQLTPVGKAIYARTSGGKVGAGASSSAVESATSAAASMVSTAAGMLSSLGVDISA